MDIDQRIKAFLRLEEKTKALSEKKRETVYRKAIESNRWFTREHIDLAFHGLYTYLEKHKLEKWLASYQMSPQSVRTVGVVMAGNIPMVGVHDLLCVLLSGHRINIKLSSQDDVLIPFLAETLISVEPRFADRILFSDRLKRFDAVIATGSDNSSRYFRYYFSHVPNIIRKNRTSVAVLSGHEDKTALDGLSRDIHEYFGLGCRNVSKIFIPAGYDIRNLIPHLQTYAHFLQHNKYANNYDYQKAILSMNQQPYMDTGAGLMKEDEQLVSPISVTYYSTYDNMEKLNDEVRASSDKIQCIVSEEGLVEGSVSPGSAQRPEVWDYADGVDTLRFLEAL